jgi:hypothetical protein
MNGTEPSGADSPVSHQQRITLGCVRRFTQREGYPVSLAAG